MFKIDQKTEEQLNKVVVVNWIANESENVNVGNVWIGVR